MIRPAVITDEISQDFERALDVMAEYGVRTAELRGLWGTNIMDLSPAQLDRARTALRERGMHVCGLASPIYKCHLDPEPTTGSEGPLHLARETGREEQLTLLSHAMELCDFFNTRLIRIFAFWRVGDVTPSVQARIADALTPAVRQAEAAGVVLGLENEHACFLGTGAETGPIFAAIDSPALRCVWDPGNAYCGQEVPFPDGYNRVQGYVDHLHVKDAIRDADGRARWVVVGEGDIDFAGQFQALVSDGYEGYASLETHYKAEGGDPEASSRQCLQGMLRLLEESGTLAQD